MEAQAHRHMIAQQDAHWWFVARRKILRRLLARFVPIRADTGGRVLDAGAGTGANLAMLSEFGQVTAVERSPLAAAHIEATYGVAVVREAIPAQRSRTAPGGYDLVAALDLIEHIEEDDRAIRFLAERLAPGGWLLVTVPAFQCLWSSHDEALSHHRRYRKRGLVRQLQAAGIEVAYASYFNCLLFPIAAAHRLIRRVRAAGAQEPTIPPPWLNRILQFAFGLEAGLVGRVRLPIGLSVVAIGRKATSG